jgi:hypothetical protein
MSRSFCLTIGVMDPNFKNSPKTEIRPLLEISLLGLKSTTEAPCTPTDKDDVQPQRTQRPPRNIGALSSRRRAPSPIFRAEHLSRARGPKSTLLGGLGDLGGSAAFPISNPNSPIPALKPL